MHNILQRQLRRFLGENAALSPELAAFVRVVDLTYQQFDDDREMLERSLDLSSKELMEASSEMRAILQAWPDIIFRVAEDGVITNFSASNISDVCAPFGGLVGKRFDAVPSPELRLRFRNAMDKAKASGQMVTVEYNLPMGQEGKIFEARFLSISNEKLLVIVQNITGRKRLENVIHQSEKLSAVGQLAGGVAHEINNPLAVILGFSQALLHNLKEDDPLANPLRHIERETLRCKTLVSDLLTISRTSNTDQHYPLNINDAINESFSLINAQGRVRNVEIKADLSPDVPLILGNKNRIQQVVINLCNNGIDAMSHGGKLEVRTARVQFDARSGVLLEVMDTGAGIPPEIQKKIFEPFFTTKDVGKGTGLGLSLVFEIVQKHGGTIDLESAKGKGTTFRITFPEAPAEFSP